jgi:hypothetical protein
MCDYWWNWVKFTDWLNPLMPIFLLVLLFSNRVCVGHVLYFVDSQLDESWCWVFLCCSFDILVVYFGNWISPILTEYCLVLWFSPVLLVLTVYMCFGWFLSNWMNYSLVWISVSFSDYILRCWTTAEMSILVLWFWPNLNYCYCWLSWCWFGWNDY